VHEFRERESGEKVRKSFYTIDTYAEVEKAADWAAIVMNWLSIVSQGRDLLGYLPSSLPRTHPLSLCICLFLLSLKSYSKN
jgi:hypothetical protein